MTQKITQREFACEVVQNLRAAGYESLWAGGCVRDQLLGREPKDYDVATSAEPDQVRAVFGKRRTIPVGASFGVITLLGPHHCDPIEIATFRTDGAYRDGRHPESVAFSDAQHDAQRRDFTVNGLFYDPLADRVIDYVGGQEDLGHQVLRAIGDPRRRFDEDKLRMLRAVRFAANLGFDVESRTMAAVQEMASQIDVVSPERIGAELRRILTHASRKTGLELLAATALLPLVLPEVAERYGAKLERGAAVIEAAHRLDQTSLPAGLACLLAEFGPTCAIETAKRLRYTNKEGERAAWIVEQLPRVGEAHSLAWPQRQRLATHQGIDELLAVASAWLGSEHLGVQRLQADLLLPPESLNPPLLATGDDLIRAGLKPGKRFGKLLERLRDLQLEGRLTTSEQAIAEALRIVESGEADLS
ncbi:MAG: CCA tRNA nucleotidyltransferase [Planctomycetales bacterium]|nr:CCA tRNA nucleotidyltransferase [Planctomycetales bacterium]